MKKLLLGIGSFAAAAAPVAAVVACGDDDNAGNKAVVVTGSTDPKIIAVGTAAIALSTAAVVDGSATMTLVASVEVAGNKLVITGTNLTSKVVITITMGESATDSSVAVDLTPIAGGTTTHPTVATTAALNKVNDLRTAFEAAPAV